MKSHLSIRFFAALLAVSLWCVSCDSGGAALLNGGSNPGGSNSGDVNNDGGDVGRDGPFDGSLSARVRNESSARVDVTMRFIREDEVVHLAFVRVPSATITTVASPEMVDVVELSGLDEGGRALDAAVFKYGVDFDERTPAEYIVVDRNAPQVPGDDPQGLLRLSLLEPQTDTTVTLGSALPVRWSDAGGGPSALVRLFLQPEGVTTSASLRSMSPAIGAALDGINDEFALLVQGVAPGSYALVAELADEDRTVQAVAPGRVTVRDHAGNVAPQVSILEPRSTVELYADERLTIRWSDVDPDDNATIAFTLEQPQTASTTTGQFRIGPPVAEDPDGAVSDQLSVSLGGVLPGLYDLVATIDDGELRGVERVERAVRVLPALSNDPPSLIVLTPAQDKHVMAGDSIEVRWSDGDANDDARISFLIDANWSRVGLSGGERLLVSGLSEDEDGGAGSAVLTIPADVGAGKYRLIGVITDGMTQVVTRAPGFLLIEGDPTVVVGDGGSDSDDPGDGDDGSGDDGGDDSGDDPGGSDDGDTDDDNVADGGGSGSGSDTGGDGDGGGDGSDPGVVVIDTPVEVPGQRVSDPVEDASERPSEVVNNGGGEEEDPDDPETEVVVIGRPVTVDQERGAEPANNPIFDIGLVAQSPVVPAGITLTNEPYGGNVRVPLDPPSDWNPTDIGALMQLRVPLEAIPNHAWPRRFDLIAVYEVNGATQTYVWPRPVEIPQLVEVSYAGLTNSMCTSVGPQRWATALPFRGLTIGWYGGGVSESSGRAQVEFWLSGDGLVPTDGRDNATHRLLYAGLGMPNQYTESQVDLSTVVLGGVASMSQRELNRVFEAQREQNNRTTLAPGEYTLLTVVDYGEFGRVVSRPDVDLITICPAVIETVLND